MLGKFNIGLEPDRRFGGANLRADGKAVLFRFSKDVPKTASREYRAATVLLRLAATISGADGTVTDSERGYLKSHIEDVMKMSPGEKARFQAHADWLLHDLPGLAGLKTRLKSLTSDEKKSIAGFCISVAGADGHIDPSEIRTLAKLYPLLGLNADDVYTDIHSMMSSAAAPSEAPPTIVRKPGPADKGYRIPPAPTIEEMRSRGVALDMRIVQAKIRETREVTRILGDIFADQEVEKPAPEPAPADDKTIGSLDADHSKILRALIQQTEWSREDFESLAESFGLLPDGALDLINDAAYEMCDQPLVDGDDRILIDMDVAKELMS